MKSLRLTCFIRCLYNDYMSRRFLMLFIGFLLVASPVKALTCFAMVNSGMDCCKIYSTSTLHNPYNRCCSPQEINTNTPLASEKSFSLNGFQGNQTLTVFLPIPQVANLSPYALTTPNNEHWGGLLKHPSYIQNARLLL